MLEIAKSYIPFRSWNFDSWWYPKVELQNGNPSVHDGAVKNWTAIPDIFPHGLEYVFSETSTPVVAHNRFWCNCTDYAKQNGGKYDFILNKNGAAIPNDDL